MSQILTKLPNVNLGSIDKKARFINSEFNDVLKETDKIVSETINNLVNYSPFIDNFYTNLS